MRRRYRVADPTGLHARPAAEFVRALVDLPGAVRVERGEKSANAKSILQVLGLGVRQGDLIVLDFAEADTDRVAELEARLAALLAPEGEPDDGK